MVGVRWLPRARRAWPPGAGPLTQAATAPTSVAATVGSSSSSSRLALPLVLSVELDDEATLAAMCAAGGGIADGFSVVRPLAKEKAKKEKEKEKRRSSGDDDNESGDEEEEVEEEGEKPHRRASKARRRL